MASGWKTRQDWVGLPQEDEYLNYINLLLQLFCLLLILTLATFLYLVFVIYIFSLVAYIYKKMNNVPEDILSNSWHKLRQFLGHFFIKLGKIMHDHEIIGMEHIPEGPGIIAFYHGTINMDHLCLIAKLYTQERKICFTIADKALFLVPGWKFILDACGCICGNKADCVEILKKGHLLAIAPGGGREALFSDCYTLIWGKRIGFAQVALEAKVPIIPMFTENIQEVFRVFGKIGLMRWLYEKTRRMGPPLYGGFPVKLRTYLGEPIPYDPNITAVELAEKTKLAIENLRDRYQKIPGNILRAVSERFGKHHKDD